MDYPERIFKRRIYDKIAEWKLTRDGSTARLIRGADDALRPFPGGVALFFLL